MSFRLMTGVVGASLLLIAAYQLVTGSLALHVGRAGRPSIPMNPRGARLFAMGLVSFGILLAILAWQPVQIPDAIAVIVVVGLLVLAFVFWWSAIRTWTRDRPLS